MDKNTYYKVYLLENDIYDVTIQAAEILDFHRNHGTLTSAQRNEISYAWVLLIEAHNRVRDLEK